MLGSGQLAGSRRRVDDFRQDGVDRHHEAGGQILFDQMAKRVELADPALGIGKIQRQRAEDVIGGGGPMFRLQPGALGAVAPRYAGAHRHLLRVGPQFGQQLISQRQQLLEAALDRHVRSLDLIDRGFLKSALQGRAGIVQAKRMRSECTSSIAVRRLSSM